MRKYRRRPRVLQEKVGEFRQNGQTAREKVMKNTCFEEKVGCNETEHNYGFDRYLASKVIREYSRVPEGIRVSLSFMGNVEVSLYRIPRAHSPSFGR